MCSQNHWGAMYAKRLYCPPIFKPIRHHLFCPSDLLKIVTSSNGDNLRLTLAFKWNTTVSIDRLRWGWSRADRRPPTYRRPDTNLRKELGHQNNGR
jgi:hypothetical protein